MSKIEDLDVDSSLILAAEECPPEAFAKYHRFSHYDDIILRKLTAHGPVLLRGGRGSGKSALLIEAHRRIIESDQSVFASYVSLRYLPLIQADGEEYISLFCQILSRSIQEELKNQGISADFQISLDQVALQNNLSALAVEIGRRIVLLFDDAAHIGRERPLEVFFDLFRTISSGLTSCKASIYPGVTKFGVRFDVFNDSTVIDISRSDISADVNFFPDVVKARYPNLSSREKFSDRLSPSEFANLMGRAVVGNMRGLILACNRFSAHEKIGLPEVTKCFLDMATDYYWPLMEEVAPKLGVYEPLIEPSRETVEIIFEHASRTARDRSRSSVPDRVLIHRQIVAHFAKVFEIIEYLGFISKREASRAMKSGGRGPVYALNLCNLLDNVPSRRLTFEMIQEWLSGAVEPAELHSTGPAFSSVRLPTLNEEHGLAILDRDVEVLGKSPAYPYGLTTHMIGQLKGAGLTSVGHVAAATDTELDRIEQIGVAKIRRIRNVVQQAIWM